jgi:hypothetical protein
MGLWVDRSSFERRYTLQKRRRTLAFYWAFAAFISAVLWTGLIALVEWAL